MFYGLHAIFVEKKETTVNKKKLISYLVYNYNTKSESSVLYNSLNDIYDDSGEHFCCAYGIDK